jgi:general stress protein YciG
MAERKQSSSSGTSHRGGSGNFAEDRERKQSSSSGTSHRGGSGNFAEDRERASEAGRKGGQSRGDR